MWYTGAVGPSGGGAREGENLQQLSHFRTVSLIFLLSWNFLDLGYMYRVFNNFPL